MKESSEKSGLKKSIDRLKTATVFVGLLGGAAVWDLPDHEKRVVAHALEEISNENIKDKFHAANVYMSFGDGLLQKNFEKLQEIGKKLHDIKDDVDREQKRNNYNVDIEQIETERDEILVKLDAVLIPTLLAMYIQGDALEKILVQAYKELGGDVDKVRAEGLKGVDQSIASGISSKMMYHLESDLPNFGNARYDALEFEISD